MYSYVRVCFTLFYSVSVVDVDVDVQHAIVVLEQLQDGQHNVVDVAEAWVEKPEGGTKSETHRGW